MAVAALASHRCRPDWSSACYSRGFYAALQRRVTPVSNLVPVALLDVRGARRCSVAGRCSVQACLRVTMRLAARAGAARRSDWTVFGGGHISGVPGLVGAQLPAGAARTARLDFDHVRASTARRGACGSRQPPSQIVNARLRARPTPSSTDSARCPASFATAQRLLGAWTSGACPGGPKLSLLGLVFPLGGDRRHDRSLLPRGHRQPGCAAGRAALSCSPHEWAHLAGYADESEANFVAWLACAHGERRHRYSGWLALYAHLSGALPREDRRRLAEHARGRASRQICRRSTPACCARPRSSAGGAGFYDSYLKANRVERGILQLRRRRPAGARNTLRPQLVATVDWPGLVSQPGPRLATAGHSN